MLYIIGNVRLITLEQIDIELIYDIIKSGWNDIFDAILYTAHKSTKIPLLTMDRSFYEFLNKKGFVVKDIIMV
ncbi:hypothetical protein [Saccharolobus sp. E5-1-F]|uniref:hypothetical protein n=1 Tax=Saccharolobus sp. E5-1-F TaxID=2663019 RepID=UPI001EE7DDAF|nr:hypothetical protein [Sulfolobus sp. E5-1-F]